MTDRRQQVALGVLGLFALLAAMLVHHRLFALYSLDRDDSVYVAMARVIQHGHVTLPAQDAAFRPWASAVVGDRIVFKYSPPWPAVLAAISTLGGPTGLALGLTAAGAAILAALLAAEVCGDVVVGLVAGGLLAVSPMFLVQSGTTLPYVFQLALELAVALLLLRGTRRRRTADVVAAGVVLGIAGWARPYDAVLVAAPFIVVGVARMVAGRHSGQGVWLWWAFLLRLIAGGAPVAAISLLYNAAVMGSPLRLPYTVTGPQDGFGFGDRGVFPEYTSPFTPPDGVAGLTSNLHWLPSWTAGGIVLVVLAVVGLFHTVGDARWAVAALAVVVPMAYLPFWGPYVIGRVWNGVGHFGPFYYLPVLVPVVTFGAASLVALLRRARSTRPGWVRPGTVAVVVAMMVLTGLSVPDKVSANVHVQDEFRALQRLVDDRRVGRAVLLLPSRGNLGFNSSSPFLVNDPELRQPVLYAETRGAADFDLLDRFPDRPLYRLSQELPPGETIGGRMALDLLHAESGPVVTVRLRMRNPTDGSLAVGYVYDGVGPERSVTLDAASGAGRSYDVSWAVVAPAADAVAAPHTVRPTARSGVLAVGLEVRGPGTSGRRWERRIAYRTLDGGTRVQLLRPGQGWSRGEGPGATWQVDESESPVELP